MRRRTKIRLIPRATKNALCANITPLAASNFTKRANRPMNLFDRQYGGRRRQDVFGHSIPAHAALLSCSALVQAKLRLRLLESFYVLGNGLGLFIAESRNTLVVRRFAVRLAFRYVFCQFVHVERSSFQRRGFHRRLAFTAGTVASRTLSLVKGRSIGGCPSDHGCAQ